VFSFILSFFITDLPANVRLFAKSHGSSVSITNGCRLDDREVEVQLAAGSRIFTSPHRPDWLWDLPSLPSYEYQVLFLGIRHPGCGADHTAPLHLHDVVLS
jgi:hypothetical protein